jgi:hypothetical protein
MMDEIRIQRSCQTAVQEKHASLSTACGVLKSRRIGGSAPMSSVW